MGGIKAEEVDEGADSTYLEFYNQQPMQLNECSDDDDGIAGDLYYEPGGISHLLSRTMMRRMTQMNRRMKMYQTKSKMNSKKSHRRRNRRWEMNQPMLQKSLETMR